MLPVRLSDPQASVVYSYFIDYNSITGDGWISSDVSAPVIGASPGAQRNLEIAIPEPSSDRCHVVEIVVALNLNPFLDGRNAHTPLAPGGDSVTWFYSPGGTLMGCPTIDAKLQPDATALDAIRDGGGL